MTAVKIDRDLSDSLEEVKRRMADGVETDEIRSVLEDMISTLDGKIVSGDADVIAELEELSSFIEQTRSEIAAINPEEIPDEHIPAATDELDAVVDATEAATNSIMEAAEIVEAVAEEISADQAARLSDAVTQIYEACSFQDITGQRINKVVTALREIEAKVETVVEKFGPDPETREEMKRKRKAEKESASAADVDGMTEEDLLEGPQMPENANSQDDIDALLADMG